VIAEARTEARAGELIAAVQAVAEGVT